jgi:hypothetical protein
MCNQLDIPGENKTLQNADSCNTTLQQHNKNHLSVYKLSSLIQTVDSELHVKLKTEQLIKINLIHNSNDHILCILWLD